jgi:hypothetical protein
MTNPDIDPQPASSYLTSFVYLQIHRWFVGAGRLFDMIKLRAPAIADPRATNPALRIIDILI